MPFVEKEILQFHSTRLTPKKAKKNIFIPPKEKSNPKNISKQKEWNNLNLNNKLQNNEYFFSKILSNKFKLNHHNSYSQKKYKNILKNQKINNKKRKKSHTVKAKFSKYSFDMNKPNNIANKNFQKENKIMMTELKEKRFSEEKRGLNNLFYNSDKIKTNIINKRKNNNLFNLSNYIKSKNIEQIKREIQEINISRNNFNDNTYKKEKENNLSKSKRNLAYIKNGLINPLKAKAKNNKNFNLEHQLTINNYNTSIKNYRVLNVIDSYQIFKKIFEKINKRRKSVSFYKIRKNRNYRNNITSAYSLLIDTEKTENKNDYDLNVLVPYYTINNTINITNNHSSIGNIINGHIKNNKKMNSVIRKKKS